jgi:hypothetical protein
MQMAKFRTSVAIAALLISTPAMACTDWQAVAKFDEMIAKHHGLLWSSSNCNGIEYIPNSKIREMYKDGKQPPTKTEVCSYYQDAADADYVQMEQHRDAAIKDECK